MVHAHTTQLANVANHENLKLTTIERGKNFEVTKSMNRGSSLSITSCVTIPRGRDTQDS